MAGIFDLFNSIKKEQELPTGAPGMVIAFLGNPGNEYSRTRHNAGFMCAEYLEESKKLKIDRFKFRSLTAETVLGGKKVLLMKPQTFMNLSGEAVREAVAFYKLDPEKQLLTVYDDISLDVGRLRIREKGSDGGHNGIKNIIYQLGTDVFPRIKIGVGNPPAGFPLVEWVLGRIPKEEQERFFDALKRASAAIETIASGSLVEAMNRYNGA